MDIKVINSSTIEVTLGKDFFSDRGLDFKSMLNHPQMMSVFLDSVTTEVEKVTGIIIDGTPISMEFYCFDGGYKLILHLMNDEDLKKLEEEDGCVTHESMKDWLADKLNKQDNDNGNSTEDNTKTNSSISSYRHYIVSFNKLDDMCRMCKVLEQHGIKEKGVITSSTAYRISGVYQLILTVTNDSNDRLKNVLEPLLDEFLLHYKSTNDLEKLIYHYNEHGKVLVKDNATGVLSNL